MTMTGVNVLDTTLRDGSYAVDFRFTAADTARICRGLDAAGFHYIEIGHGLGLRAHERGHGRAAATDEEYLRAARGACTKASYGMFCIPGIAILDDVEIAADHGAGFIRLGTDVSDVAKMQPFVRLAKQRGLLVCANLMKSYAVGADNFARAVRQCESYGADVVYLVDSAGCMFPEEVSRYVLAVRDVSSVSLGFHGHDNLRMAVYNSLRMLDMGAVVIDGSLQGLGRSAGNAMTEVLIAALHRRGQAREIDLFRTFEVGDNCVRPILTECGIVPLDVVAGFAGFHSSFLPKVQRVAARHRVEPARLIIELCKVTRTDADEDLLERLAGDLHLALHPELASDLLPEELYAHVEAIPEVMR
jgi:4-hydroxy-2-oxovalerate aldolase